MVLHLQEADDVTIPSARPDQLLPKMVGFKSEFIMQQVSKDTVRFHRGDIMSPETRSAVMARIKGKDTGPEKQMAAMLRRSRRRFETHARDLPGRPDFVFRRAKVALFVDGDFWHGWRFPAWRFKLSQKWETKIEGNRRRDRRNQAKLKRAGWTVIRVWEHQMKRDPEACLRRVLEALARRPGRRSE